MAWRQVTNPNVGVAAIRGWCLKYVDDSTNAPRRTPSARAAINVEVAAGRLRGDEPPVGLWVTGFLDMQAGSYAAVDHVFLMKNLGGGRYEIRDSETNSGQRAPYGSIAELLGWFGKYAPVYIGWSTQCDGAVYVENVPDPVPATTAGLIARKGTFTVTVDVGVNVRSEPNINSTRVAGYAKGEKINYDSYIIANNYVWLSYIGASGNRRYVAEGPMDGNPNNVWGVGGV